jgi:hypothetical protein
MPQPPLCRHFARACSALLVSGFALTAVSADTIRLKNGQTVTGKIVKYDNRKFTIVYERASPETQATIALEDVDSVEFDGRPLPSGYASAGGRDTGEDRLRPTNPPDDAAPAPRPGGRPGARPDGPDGGPESATERTLTVAAKDDWTYARIDVQRGDRIRITANGSVRLNSRLESTPDGVEVEDKNKLMPGRPTGALIAVIGDDNDDFIFVGGSREFMAQRSGKLFLSVNEGDLSDNSGGFEARVQVTKARP